jgi:hypothetical protein
LDQAGGAAPSSLRTGFIRHGESPVAAAPQDGAGAYPTAIGSTRRKRNIGCRIVPYETDEFSQTLGKQFFPESRFELSENLRLNLLDYAEKRTDAANITFNARC